MYLEMQVAVAQDYNVSVVPRDPRARPLLSVVQPETPGTAPAATAQ